MLTTEKEVNQSRDPYKRKPFPIFSEDYLYKELRSITEKSKQTGYRVVGSSPNFLWRSILKLRFSQINPAKIVKMENGDIQQKCVDKKDFRNNLQRNKRQSADRCSSTGE